MINSPRRFNKNNTQKEREEKIMALITCPECGKEISDKATACPNCGCPVSQKQTYIPAPPTEIPSAPPTPLKMRRGCLVSIILFFILFSIGISIGIANKKNHPEKYDNSIAVKYIDVTIEEGEAIDLVLNDCGITEIKSFEHDELLDNAHMDGESGYRLAVENIDNIILYLAHDKTVFRIRYIDYDLYADGRKLATLQDYVVSKEEVDKYQYLCQEKVKEVLNSPSTAKFPAYTEWGWRQEMNIFTVQGYVDAQNGFGAEIRSHFQFIIDINTDTIQSFIFDGQELIQQQ